MRRSVLVGIAVVVLARPLPAGEKEDVLDEVRQLCNALAQREDAAGKRAHRCVAALLDGVTPEERKEAIAALDALGDEGQPLGPYVAATLLWLGPEAADVFGAWVRRHGDRGSAVLWATLHTRVDPTPGLALFAEWMHDDVLAAPAIAALGRIGAAARVHAAAMRAICADESADPWLRRQAAEALGGVGASDEETLRLLTVLLDHADEEVVLGALGGLAALGPSAAAAAPRMSRLLSHEAAFVADRAIHAIRSTGTTAPAVVAALVRAFETENDTDRAMELLRAIGTTTAESPKGRDVLAAASRDPRTEVRVAAIVVRHLQGEGTERLRAALRDPRECGHAIYLLGFWHVAPGPFRAELLDLLGRLGGLDVVTQPMVLHLAAQVGPGPEEIARIRALAEDPAAAPWVREAAAGALRDLAKR